MKLISLTTLVSILKETTPYLNNSHNAFVFVNKTINYANFIQQPLTLGMFIPTNEKGEVLSNPFANDEDAGTEKELKQIEFNNALKRVIFEGCSVDYYNRIYCSGKCIGEIIKGKLFSQNKTIESLIPYNLTITEKAINQFKLR